MCFINKEDGDILQIGVEYETHSYNECGWNSINSSNYLCPEHRSRYYLDGTPCFEATSCYSTNVLEVLYSLSKTIRKAVKEQRITKLTPTASLLRHTTSRLGGQTSCHHHISSEYFNSKDS